MSTPFTAQEGFDIRMEWGEQGVRALSPVCDVLILVDVLSFSTSVAIAVGNGAEVIPFRHAGPEGDSAAQALAEREGAILASRNRFDAGYSLSPSSLLDLPRGKKLLLPSPNGSALSVIASSFGNRSTGNTQILAGGLINAAAVAQGAMSLGTKIGLIAAGERWPDGSLRPSFEDQIGAGAILRQLLGTKSPEAEGAEAIFEAHRDRLREALLGCSSGRELRERGFTRDVVLAAELNRSKAVPWLNSGLSHPRYTALLPRSQSPAGQA